MNYIRHMNAFFTCLKKDTRLTSSHVSLYLALFQYWNYNRFHNPFPVYRDNIMNLSKIGSKNTYHKCIKELHQARYIYYHPSKSKFLPVKISIARLDIQEEPPSRYKQLYLFPEEMVNPTSPIFDTGSVPNLTTPGTDNDTHTVPKMGHIIKPNIKEKTVFKNTHPHFLKSIEAEKQNSLARVPKMGHDDSSHPERSEGSHQPSLYQVETFFKESHYPAVEASKFYYYNNGRGWMINDKLPVKNWQSLVHKWMLNPGKYNTVRQPAEDPYKDLQYLYERYQEGENIFRYITSDHFDQLNLQLTEETMIAARQERMNQLTGSNSRPILILLQAYQDNKENDQILINDRNNFINVAKRIAVLKYINMKV